MMNNRLLRLVFLLILLGMMPCQSIAPISTVTRTPHPRDDETSQDEDEEEEDEESLLTLLAAGGAAVAAVGGAAYFFQKVYKKSGPTNVRNPNVVVLPEGNRGDGASARPSDGKNEDDEGEPGSADQKKDEQPGAAVQTKNKQPGEPGDNQQNFRLHDRKIPEEKKQNLFKPLSRVQLRPVDTSNEGQEPGESGQSLQPGAAEQKDEDSGGESGAAGQEGVDAGDDGRDSKELKQKNLPKHDYKGNSGRQTQPAEKFIRSLDDDEPVAILQESKTPKKATKQNSSDDEDDVSRTNSRQYKYKTWPELSIYQRRKVKELSILAGARKKTYTTDLAMCVATFLPIVDDLPQSQEKKSTVQQFTTAVTQCECSGVRDSPSYAGSKAVLTAWKAHSNLLHDVVSHYFWRVDLYQGRIQEIFGMLTAEACLNKTIDARDKNEQTALFFACSQPYKDLKLKFEIIKLLIDSKASVNSRNPPADKKLCEQRPLQVALQHTNSADANEELRIVRLLVDKGASLSLFCCNDNDPVIRYKKAIISSYLPKEIFLTLDVLGRSPLYRIIKSKQYSTKDIVALLDKYKFNVNFPYGTDNRKLLCDAPVRSVNAVMHCGNKLLQLSKNAKICYRTPLQLIVTRGDNNKELLDCLFSQGANMTCYCCKKHDPLAFVHNDKKGELATQIQKSDVHNRYFQQQDKTGRTFLHRMLEFNYPLDSVETFIKEKIVYVNPVSKTDEEKCQYSPVQYVIMRYIEGKKPADLEYLKLLTKYGADIYRTCCFKHDPIMKSKESGDGKLMSILLATKERYDSELLPKELQNLSQSVSGIVDDVGLISISDPLDTNQEYVRQRFCKNNVRGSLWTKRLNKECLLYYHAPCTYETTLKKNKWGTADLIRIDQKDYGTIEQQIENSRYTDGR